MINKNFIVDVISEKYYDSKAKAEKVVSEIFDIITNHILNNEKVNISGFGYFDVKKIKEKNARNPKTGEKIVVPEHRKLIFRQSQNIKEILKKNN